MQTELYHTAYFNDTYEEQPLACTIADKQLRVNLVFTEFHWEEGDSGWPDKYDGDGEPHAILAISEDGLSRIWISTVSPAAEELLRRGLVKDAPC